MTTASKGISVRGKSAKRSTPAKLQIRNVLVPIDFSAPSLEAIEAALPLIKHFGADLHLVHVFEPDYPASSMVAIPLVVPELEVGERVRRPPGCGERLFSAAAPRKYSRNKRPAF